HLLPGNCLLTPGTCQKRGSSCTWSAPLGPLITAPAACRTSSCPVPVHIFCCVSHAPNANTYPPGSPCARSPTVGDPLRYAPRPVSRAHRPCHTPPRAAPGRSVPVPP